MKNFALTIFLVSLAAVLLLCAALDMGFQLTSARKDIVVALGSIAFLAFIAWLDAIATERNKRA